MKAKDSIFIILTIVLLGLFGITISENLKSLSFDATVTEPRLQKEKKIEDIDGVSRILTRLEEIGLKPREAKYYRVIE